MDLQSWLMVADLSSPAESRLGAPLYGIDHPRARAVYPPEVVETFGALWASPHALLDQLDHLPNAFCHRDAFARNLFLRELDGGSVETIAIDWDFASIGFPARISPRSSPPQRFRWHFASVSA